MRELHLFAGIGGGILGGTLLGHTCVAAVEIDPYAREVLLARQADGTLPSFPVFQSVVVDDREQRELFGDPGVFVAERWRGRVDVVAGGFPCQDVSQAGKRKGLQGARSGLWREMVRTVRAVEPTAVFVENVPGLLSVNRGRDFGTVLGDLAELGFDAEWVVRSAEDLGAPHRRKRLWILAAHPERMRLRHQPVAIAERGGAAVASGDGEARAVAEPRADAGDEGARRRISRSREDDPHADGSGRGAAERIVRPGEPHAGGLREAHPDTDSWRREVERVAEPHGLEGARGDLADGLRDARELEHGASRDVRDPVREGLAERERRGRDGAQGTRGGRARTSRAGWWSVEPRVGRVAHGVPARVDRLRTLGNAQVPAVAAAAFKELLARFMSP